MFEEKFYYHHEYSRAIRKNILKLLQHNFISIMSRVSVNKDEVRTGNLIY
jgi:hypothetical protein